MTWQELLRARAWRPIRHCPGRYVLAGPPSRLRPQEIAGEEIPTERFQTPAAPDPVVVAPLEAGGLISYEKPDGTYVHTLNTPEGFERKLNTLGRPA